MARTAEYFHYGSLAGSAYTFHAVGDILSMHNHTDENAHISIVTNGSFTVRFLDAPDMKLIAGDMRDFPVGQPHEFESLEPDSKIINVIKKAQA